MEDYETGYEEYKKSILQNRPLRNKLYEKYCGSISAEADYIDGNGVLWKIGILGAVCGFCIALTFTLRDSGLWFLGIVLFLAIMGSIIWARHIGAKFKKDSGETNFYAFRYHKYFEDRIQEDKKLKERKFEESLSKTISFMQRCANNPSNDPSEVLHCALRYVEELEQQYKELSEYDNFAEWLKNDWHFNAEIQKNIDKYI